MTRINREMVQIFFPSPQTFFFATVSSSPAFVFHRCLVCKPVSSQIGHSLSSPNKGSSYQCLASSIHGGEVLANTSHLLFLMIVFFFYREKVLDHTVFKQSKGCYAFNIFFAFRKI